MSASSNTGSPSPSNPPSSRGDAVVILPRRDLSPLGAEAADVLRIVAERLRTSGIVGRAACSWCGHPPHPPKACRETVQDGPLVGERLPRRIAPESPHTYPCPCARPATETRTP